MADQSYSHPQPVALENTVRIAPAIAAAQPAAAAAAPAIAVAQCRATPRKSSDPVNPDETNNHPDFRGNFHKGLHHAANGVVVQAKYQAMVDILRRTARNPAEFESIPLDQGRPLTNPQAGKATDVLGPYPKKMRMLPAPTVDSLETAVEAIELYWMALLRDTPFTAWSADATVAQATSELTTHEANFYGPTVNGSVTPQTLFRGCSPLDSVGPYLSQFLLRDIPYGSLTISQRQRTAVSNKDYLTNSNEWLAAQNGAKIDPGATLDATPRYIRNLRDLAEYVHVDALYEAYLNACLILLGAKAPLNPGNPYNGSSTQFGFGTWGGAAHLEFGMRGGYQRFEVCVVAEMVHASAPAAGGIRWAGGEDPPRCGESGAGKRGGGCLTSEVQRFQADADGVSGRLAHTSSVRGRPCHRRRGMRNRSEGVFR